MDPVSQFRQSLVRAIMKTTNNKSTVVVWLVNVLLGHMVTSAAAIPLNR